MHLDPEWRSMMKNKLNLILIALVLAVLMIGCQQELVMPTPTHTPTAVATEAPAATEAPVVTEAPVGPECLVLEAKDVPAPYVALGVGNTLATEDAAITVVTTYTGCKSVTSAISYGIGNYTVTESVKTNVDGNWEVTQIFVLQDRSLDRGIGKVACNLAKFILTAPERDVLSTKSSQIFWRPGQGEKLPEDCGTYNP